ncbi:hypothetical protein C0Q70_03059 [Pomacea canaliculata]|uniref:Uncharacterized protein n=1 Tax=Pomacea canaliculata TaxID=400727 RepID=A0A2T7PRP3_POMCA|nr:hypothetical protein C0Q70_03059 [Pomacea canaliculata]
MYVREEGQVRRVWCQTLKIFLTAEGQVRRVGCRGSGAWGGVAQGREEISWRYIYGEQVCRKALESEDGKWRKVTISHAVLTQLWFYRWQMSARSACDALGRKRSLSASRPTASRFSTRTEEGVVRVGSLAIRGFRCRVSHGSGVGWLSRERGSSLSCSFRPAASAYRISLTVSRVKERARVDRVNAQQVGMFEPMIRLQKEREALYRMKLHAHERQNLRPRRGDCFVEVTVLQTTKTAFWLILPVVICLSQRLSHACLSSHPRTVKPRMAH